jgi:hypothetical protein
MSSERVDIEFTLRIERGDARAPDAGKSRFFTHSELLDGVLKNETVF